MKNDHLEDGSELWTNVLAWLRANEIRPEDIPADPTMTFAGDQLTTDVFVRSAEGRKLLADDGKTAQRRVATFAITVPPPSDVAEWLRSARPSSGR